MDERWFLGRDDLAVLVAVLRREHRVLAPQVRSGAIVLAELADVADLPWGVHDVTAPGRYRLEETDPHDRDDPDDVPAGRRAFDHAVGPQGLKPLTFAPREALWRSRRSSGGRLAFEAVVEPAPRTAVLGARACDLAALQLLDQHFSHREQPDPAFARRRRSLFLVAVDCARPAATCFCASTGDGPVAAFGYDLALAELDDGYVVRARSEAGSAVLDALRVRTATDAEVRRAERQGAAAAAAQHRRLPGVAVAGALLDRLDSPRWAAIAERCLSCGNCTAVCPTCFCHAEGDETLLDDPTCVEHCRQWDTCFAAGHSYLHGWVVRGDTRLRYRQWLTHKLDTWFEQFGRSGCVGCGRCLTWCPAGIDLLAELELLLDPSPQVEGEVERAGT